MRLTDICDFQGGSQPPKSEWSDIQKDGYIRMLQIRDYTQQNAKVEYIKKTNTTKTCKENDILIARYGASVGKILTGLSGAYNVAMMKVIPNENIISKRFLYQYLKSNIFQRYINNVGQRAAQAGFNKDELSDIEINLPDKNEQEKIANELEKVQDIIDIKEKQYEELNLLIKSQFVELFGNISEYQRLEDYSVLITKGASPKWQGINYQNDGTLFVTSENVREGFVDISKPKYLDNKINEILPRSILKRDDILINIVGASIGRAAKYDYDYLANINQAVALVRTQNINNIFLLTYLNSDEAIKMYDDMKKGGARENLSLKNIADLRIPKAPMELQNQFAEFVKLIDKQKFEIQKSLNEIQKLQESLMDKYFGG